MFRAHPDSMTPHLSLFTVSRFVQDGPKTIKSAKTVNDKVAEIDAQAKTIRDPKPAVRNSVWKQWNAELESPAGALLLDDEGRESDFKAAFLKSSALDETIGSVLRDPPAPHSEGERQFGALLRSCSIDSDDAKVR